MSNWNEKIRPAADRILGELRQEFTLGQCLSVSTELERATQRAYNGELLRHWRGDMSQDQAAHLLGLSVNEVASIETGKAIFGPEAMRRIRPAIKRCAAELGEENRPSQDV